MKYPFLYFLGIWFCIFTHYVNGSSNIAQNFTNKFIEIEKHITSPSLSEEQMKTDEETLLFIKKTAQDNIIKTDTFLKNEQSLLSALGDITKEENPLKEITDTSQIKRKRKEIENKIKILIGETKESHLNIAKAEELLQKLRHIQKKFISNKLFKYVPLLYNIDNMHLFLSDILSYHQTHLSLLFYGISITGIILLGILAYFIQKRFHHYILQQNYGSQKPLSVRLLFQVFLSSFVILALRFHIINIDSFLYLKAFTQLLFGSVLSLSLYELLDCFSFKRNNKETDDFSDLQNKVKHILQKISLLTIPTAVIGYTELSSFIIANILGSLVAILFFVAMRQSLIETKDILQENRHFKALHKKDKLSPLTIIIFEPLIALISIGIILFFWGMTSKDFLLWISEYERGIPIGGYFIDFSDLGAALFTLIFVLLVSKVITWFLEKRVFPYTHFDSGLQNTILTLLGYIGIIIAILSGFSIVGINMENIAIVAGALSVGIGFGLQTIFNNFVSGLILLFERPFKVGDWITIGEHEGIVKKIRVRSTELETFARSSLMIPNSLMISDPMKNFTLHNKLGRTEISIGVAYGSHTEQVKKLLLQAAEEHTNVSHYPAPTVLFMGFGDSSLDFELRCYLLDVGSRLSTSSALRFTIDQLFRDNNIDIPFPQRDIYIKNIPDTLSSSPEK